MSSQDFTGASMAAPLQHLHDYWRSKLNGRIMPSRADINPAEMKAFLPLIVLFDVKAGHRLRIRLAGTRAVEAYGSEITGSYLDELELGDRREQIMAAHAQCIASRSPYYWSEIHTRKTDGKKFRGEHLDTPLSADGEAVNMLLVGAAFVVLK